MFVHVRKGGCISDTLVHYKFDPNDTLELYIYIYIPSRRQWEATGGTLDATRGPLEATQASSRAWF